MKRMRGNVKAMAVSLSEVTLIARGFKVVGNTLPTHIYNQWIGKKLKKLKNGARGSRSRG